MKTCAFYTLGCKVNQYETQLIRENFIKSGYKEKDPAYPCDVYVINTCTVTEKSDKESRRLIRKARKQNPKAKIVITGCYAELDGDEITAVDKASLIVRNKDKCGIADIIDRKKILPHIAKARATRGVYDFKSRTKAFLKIQNGCDNFCSYCKVPLVRGRSESRDEKAVIAEAKRLLKKGFKEIVLTGICLGAWGREYSPKKSLKDLLEKLMAIKGDFRIRLSSIEPKYVEDSLLAVIKMSPKICKHLHIPFQSGDDDILRAMNRPYTLDRYMAIAKNARSKIPGIAITTDVLIGFPSEDSKSFSNTLKLIENVRPSRAHIFPYSRRSGTLASKMAGEVPKDVIATRMNAIKVLVERCSYEFRERLKGGIVKVLVEAERDKDTGFLKGYDDNYNNILIDDTLEAKYEEYISKIVPVRIKKLDNQLTIASLI